MMQEQRWSPFLPFSPHGQGIAKTNEKFVQHLAPMNVISL